MSIEKITHTFGNAAGLTLDPRILTTHTLAAAQSRSNALTAAIANAQNTTSILPESLEVKAGVEETSDDHPLTGVTPLAGASGFSEFPDPNGFDLPAETVNPDDAEALEPTPSLTGDEPTPPTEAP